MTAINSNSRFTPASRSLAAHSSPPATSGVDKKTWTVLYYGAGDNDLDKFITQDVAHMEQVGTDSGTNLVVQLDQLNKGATRRLIQKDTVPNDAIDSPVLENLGPVNMSDPANLQNFLEWGIKKYPAEHYMLLIADHGKGWKGCIQDDSHKGWMEVPQLQQALAGARKSTGVKLDMVGFDACLMASTEVAYQLRNEANYLVASQEVEGQKGWPYQLVLDPSALTSLSMNTAIHSADVSPEKLATYLVGRTSSADSIHTMSAIDLSKMDGVAQAAKDLAGAVTSSNLDRRDLRLMRDNVLKFADFNDAGDFSAQLRDKTSASQPGISQKAESLRSALDAAVIAEQHSPKYPQATGLSMEVRWPRRYDQLAFAQDTGWADLIKFLNS